MGRRPECEQCDDNDRRRKSYLCDKVKFEDGMEVRCIHKNSIKKLEMLKYYLEIFSEAMKDKFKYRYFIDLFSGPGKCYNRNADKDIGGFHDGSSLIALKLTTPFTNYIFIDSNQKTSSILRARSIELKPKSDVLILNMDSNAEIKKILDNVILGKSISVVFIDPNGLDINWSTIERLSKYKHLDLIIHFSIFDLRFNMKTYRGRNPKANAFFGSEDWPEDSTEWLQFYKNRLKSLGFKAVEEDFEGSVRIQTDTGANIYYLIYASKSNLGLKFWRQAKKYIYPDLDLFQNG